MAELTSLEVVGAFTCGSQTSVNVTLKWTSKNATEAWLEGSTIANPGSDPKSDQAIGPLGANASKQVSFNCANDYYYFNLTVYNTANNTHSGEVLQVPKA